ncbi:hypothetical protein [Streptosporangium carneum]|uniref:hypothetical protein n=1 Tax=Streptosporangium carneum TaxID=47481 RepID=UPI0022F2D2DF|nr:hypothetical protein [Streptosporangium carneum]
MNRRRPASTVAEDLDEPFGHLVERHGVGGLGDQVGDVHRVELVQPGLRPRSGTGPGVGVLAVVMRMMEVPL